MGYKISSGKSNEIASNSMGKRGPVAIDLFFALSITEIQLCKVIGHLPSSTHTNTLH